MSTEIALPEIARSFAITSADDYTRVVTFAQAMKALIAEIGETFDQPVRDAFDLHKSLCEKRREAQAPAHEALGIAKGLIVAWDDACERARAEEAVRAREADMADQLDAAVRAEAVGDFDRADALLATVVRASAPPLPGSGAARRETWIARVDDLARLVAHIAQRPDLLGLLKVNQPALDAQARSLRARLAIPGVTPVCVKGVAIRGT